jgi:hypothetical protein
VKRERFVIVLPLLTRGMYERYYQRRARCGRPVATTSLRLARKWDDRSEAYRFCKAVVKNPKWVTAYVGTA